MLISSVPPQDPRGEGPEKEHHGERFNPSLRLRREAAKGEQDIRQRYSAVRMAARQGREEVEEEKKRAVQEEEVQKVKNELEAMKSKLDAVAGKEGLNRSPEHLLGT